MHSFFRLFLVLTISHMPITAMHTLRTANKTARKTVPTRRYISEPKKIEQPPASTTPIQMKQAECSCIKPYLILSLSTLRSVQDNSAITICERLNESKLNYTLAKEQLKESSIFYNDIPSIQRELLSLEANTCPNVDTCCKKITYKMKTKRFIRGLGITTTSMTILALIGFDMVGVILLGGGALGIVSFVGSYCAYEMSFDEEKKIHAMIECLNNRTHTINSTLYKILLANNTNSDHHNATKNNTVIPHFPAQKKD